MTLDDRSYSYDLAALAKQLSAHAARARRHGIYGLEEALLAAAESAASWSRGLADETSLDDMLQADYEDS
jgi:hypothetical protein